MTVLTQTLRCCGAQAETDAKLAKSALTQAAKEKDTVKRQLVQVKTMLLHA